MKTYFRNSILGLLAIIALFNMTFAQKSGDELPNIILLIGDDHGYPYFGFMGDTTVLTPNMDLLAREGVVFSNAHVTASVCQPSLRTMMTGLHPVTYQKRADEIVAKEVEGIKGWDKLDAAEQHKRRQVTEGLAMNQFETIPRWLKDLGYVSFQGGKWWETSYKAGGFDEGMSQGWDESDMAGDEFFYQMMGGEGMELGRETNQPVFDFIDENKDQPFFLWYGPSLPHYPLDAPYKFRKYYENRGLSQSAVEYYGNCTWWDYNVGELMDYIEQAGLREKTMFVYINDNGWQQPPFVEYKGSELEYHNGGDRGKLGMYDMSFRTPLIFTWPGHVESDFDDFSLVSSLDLVPTILDFVGIEKPDDLPGFSLLPLIEGGEIEQRDKIVGYNRHFRSADDMMGMKTDGYYVRTHNWHFMYFEEFDRTELYDMAKDPFNYNDLSDQFPELVKEFLADIAVWKSEMGM